MKHKSRVFFFLLLPILACEPQPEEGFGLEVRLRISDDNDDDAVSLAETIVKLTDVKTGTVYASRSDAEGRAYLLAGPGIYRLTARLNRSLNDVAYLFSGSVENIRLTRTGSNVTGPLTVTLKGGRQSRIVIKEIYYSGCYDPDGKQYTRDAYISLYNNSDTTVWLDGLCIGSVAPIVASNTSPWLTYYPDSLPVAYIGWQFPGKGSDYPLPPGTTTTVGINSVNHTGSDYGHPNSVDLSRAEWAFYHPGLTMADIASGVKPLYMFKKLGPMSTYVFSIMGPGTILYRIPDRSAEEYASDPAHIRKTPPANTGLDYLMIHASWVIDCVDCVEDATKQSFNRTPVFIDAEPAYLPSGRYSGRALRRKITGYGNNGPIYQDTNNSFQDFEEVVPEMKPRP